MKKFRGHLDKGVVRADLADISTHLWHHRFLQCGQRIWVLLSGSENTQLACSFDADLSFNPSKLKSLLILILSTLIPGHVCVALSYRIQNYSGIFKYHHSIGHHSYCKMTPGSVFNHDYLSWLFTASLFSSNLLLSGQRFGSGPFESFCRSVSCNRPNSQVCIWDGAWLVRGALSPVKINHLSELCMHLCLEAPGSCSQA